MAVSLVVGPGLVADPQDHAPCGPVRHGPGLARPSPPRRSSSRITACPLRREPPKRRRHRRIRHALHSSTAGSCSTWPSRWEIGGTFCIKLSDGFTRALPALCVLALYSASFSAMSLAVRKIDLGVAYAVWSGVGIVANVGHRGPSLSRGYHRPQGGQHRPSSCSAWCP